MDWHQVRDPQDAELDRLAERYRLHPLHIEDCRHRNQSAKVEESRGYMFAVLKTVEIAADGSLVLADLDVFVGRDFVITVEEPKHPSARELLDGLRSAATGMRPDQVFYRITDGVVDSYLPVLDHFNEIIDELEDQVLDRPTPDTLSRIFDLVEMQRDLLTGSLDIYLSSVANRTNQVMKVLTVMGTIALPALVITGIYGMNLKGLPWADNPHATAIVSGVMLTTT